MAYVAHNARLACTPARLYSGIASIAGAGLMTVAGNWEKSGNLRNRFGAFDPVVGGSPSGDRSPAAWILAPRNGGAASRYEIQPTGQLTADLTIPIISDISAPSLSAQASLTATPYAIAAVQASITNIPDGLVTPGQILDSENVETGLSVRQSLRLLAAALAGEVSGAATTTITIRNAVADSKDRIVATVDGNGNRTAITYDLD